jgi:hypothetical protein
VKKSSNPAEQFRGYQEGETGCYEFIPPRLRCLKTGNHETHEREDEQY